MSVSCVRVPATKTARSAIIFLHGLGDSGDGWSWFPQVMKQTGLLQSQEETNFVFPNAPEIPITVNGGYRMPGWFDIYQFGGNSDRQDKQGFLKTCDLVKSLIKEQTEKHNIPAERIIIGGFSQGAAISMAVLAMLNYKIGGLVALSGFCPVVETVRDATDANGANFNTPVFQGHGSADDLIQCSFGQQTSEFYKGLGFTNWSFNVYPGVGHSTNEKELVDVIRFISLVLDK